jgi:tRNA uridine 5-carboxymethylaminomethyl modification enzyme
MGRGHELGLVPSDAYRVLREKVRQIESGTKRLSSTRIYPVEDSTRKLRALGSPPLRNPVSLFDLLKREELGYDDLAAFDGWEPIQDRQVKKQIEIEAKYEGYIRRQREAVEKMKAQEEKTIPPSMDYDHVPGLSNELRAKLKTVTPATIAQAGRIPGMTQSALASILIIMKKMKAPLADRRDDPSPRP